MNYARCLGRLSIAALAGVLISTPSTADFFVSGNHSTIVRFDSAGTPLGQFSSGGSLNNGRGVIFGPDGNMYVSSLSSNDVQRFNGATGVFIDVFVSGIGSPWDLTFSPISGNLLVSSFQGNVIEFDGTTGASLGTFASGASAAGLTFGPNGNLFVSGFGLNSVREYDGVTGAFIGDFVTPGSGGLTGPDGLTFGPDGNLYVSGRQGTHAVRRYNGATGAFIDVFVPTASVPVDLEHDANGDLLVVEVGKSGIARYNGATGAFIDLFLSGNGMSTPTHFWNDDNDPLPPPVVYCTAKTNSCGSLPAIGFSGTPSATACSGFRVTLINARGAPGPHNAKAGILLYGLTGRAAIPFNGGLLCFNPPVFRTRYEVPTNPGTPGNCDAQHEVDMNAFACGNVVGQLPPQPQLQLPGTIVNCEWWARDTVLNGSLLSDGLEYTVGP